MPPGDRAGGPSGGREAAGDAAKKGRAFAGPAQTPELIAGKFRHENHPRALLGTGRDGRHHDYGTPAAHQAFNPTQSPAIIP